MNDAAPLVAALAPRPKALRSVPSSSPFIRERARELVAHFRREIATLTVLEARARARGDGWEESFASSRMEYENALSRALRLAGVAP
jgi:hypothetical protein